ncbi:anti-sigma factor [Allokutzneria albata]|uniref:Asp23 family, cell envelope-related function n=1 Tax=Allokutzneria albata TaxID=211114 RepID=A0A1G9VLZ5_ALLAB|nr:hypothetical protein [Allokutzneria albata]SDM73262.1 hypothetical protein SAMN04489726_3119 [Allokutzneria albata]
MSGSTLPCGHTTVELLGLVVDGGLEPSDTALAAHARDCEHCRAEIAALENRWSPVRAAAAAPVELPEGLLSRVLGVVRGMRENAFAEPAEMAQEGGTLQISGRALLALARGHVADLLLDLPGVHLRGLSTADGVIRVEIAVRYGIPATEVADRLARGLEERLRASAGPVAPGTAVEVVDVLPPRPELRLPPFE